MSELKPLMDDHTALDVIDKYGCILFHFYEFTGADTDLYILHSNGKITQIEYQAAGGYGSFWAINSMSNKTEAFVKSQMKSMGLREAPNVYE